MRKFVSAVLLFNMFIIPFKAYAEEPSVVQTEDVSVPTDAPVSNVEQTMDSPTVNKPSLSESTGNETLPPDGQWVEENGNWYYYLDGQKVKGWIEVGQDKYYANEQTGARHHGWLLNQNKWYYLNPKTGVMQKNWVLENGKWYFLAQNGAMQIGWVLDNQKWYFMDRTGAMTTGWQHYQNKWYYMDRTGAMVKGWLLYQNKWYFLKDYGDMAVGWFQTGYRWYYSYPIGYIAQNATVDGYYLGHSGAWLPDLVNPRQQNYTYEQMMADINELKSHYPDLVQTEIIGQSVDGRNLYAVKMGKGEKEIFLNGSHHAREHMTTNLLMEMMDQYAQSYIDNTIFAGYHTRDLLNKTTMWFVPMVNPDGVTLVQKGHTSAKNPANVLSINGGSTDFSAWKANIRGVDLNRQYPADWANIHGDTGKPAPKNFKGYQPLSEPEALAVYNFTRAHKFKTAAAYHSSGEIIYWNFKQSSDVYQRDYNLATRYSNMTGYTLVKPTSNPSGGGFTDWFIQDMKMPSFTPEIGAYTYNKPVPVSEFDSIWNKNKAAGLMLADAAQSL